MDHFDKKFVAIKKNNFLKCSKCRNEYSSKNADGNSHIKSNRPFLLPCGHDMCENCIYQNHANLCCAICAKPIVVSAVSSLHAHQQFFLRDHFDINYFLFGEIYNTSYVLKSQTAKSNNLRKNNALMLHRDNEPLPLNKIQCGECDHAAANGYCRQCDCNFCKRCFDQIHANSKVLMKHVLVKLKNKVYNHDVKIPKPKKCKKHQKICDRYCPVCKFILCNMCARLEHQNHGYKLLVEENIGKKGELLATFENLKKTRENLQKANKDIKAIDLQLEDYATQTLENISHYFLQLHSFLQNEERRIMDHFQEMCLSPQNVIRNSYQQLKDAQSTLNTMRTKLEFYEQKPPTKIHLSTILNAFNTRLEQLQCQVLITKVPENPFVFQPQLDFRKELSKYFTYAYNDPKISINIGSVYADNLTLSTNSDSSLSPSPSPTPSSSPFIKTDQQHMQLAALNNALEFETITQRNDEVAYKKRNNKLVCITAIKSPEDFYVQMLDSLTQIRELSNAYALMERTEMLPKQIKEDHHYMVFRDDDKLWYRGVVKEIVTQNRYMIFLLDVGVSIEAPMEKFYTLKEEHLRIPIGAVRCALTNIKPALGTQWTKAANSLMFEITRNKPARLVIQQISNEVLQVDLYTTNTGEQISLRDSFLYTGLAREKSGVSNFNLQLKKLSPLSQRLPKPKLNVHKILLVKVTHIEDPQEFYVLNLDEIDARNDMQDQLKSYYDDKLLPYENIFLAQLHMCCVVQMKESWYRCSVESIKEKGYVVVRLVDDGSQETVHWRQLYTMTSNFREIKEFAIKCSLVDIAPLQSNNYEWSELANKEFQYMTSNPKLEMSVYECSHDSYTVSLHIIKKKMKYNVGALLAKNGFGVSTGEGSQMNQKELQRDAPFDNLINNISNNVRNDKFIVPIFDTVKETSLSNPKVANRTEIKVVHIVNPSEFYIEIIKLLTGIKQFREKIQEETSTLTADYPKSWLVDDHCWVFTNYKVTVPASGVLKNYRTYQWHRGIIVAVSNDSTQPEPLYSVFLRDYGCTIRSIPNTQLCTIEHEWDCVTNAVQRCHMACIKPTAGLSKWTETATDYLMHSVSTFDSIFAVLRGNIENTSLPIVLWGTTVETTDPLAPCRPRHTSINRLMVTAGLAMVNVLSSDDEIDKLLELNIPEGEISFSDCFRNFETNPLMQAIERAAQNTPYKNEQNAESSVAAAFQEDFSLVLDDLNDIIEIPDADFNDKAPEAWLRFLPINKSIFTAYPTYVDFNGVIYMHQADTHNTLLKMRYEIAKLFEKTPFLPDVVYIPGQSCVAQYHLDNCYYRGLVQKYCATDDYSVKFIDYGNVESLKIQDMRPIAPYPFIPSLASKYRLDGIQPKLKEKAFSIAVLDIVHSMIVDKLVSVRVPTTELKNEIKFCTIRVGATDLSKMLIEDGRVDGTLRRLDQSFNSRRLRRHERESIKILDSFVLDEQSIDEKRSQNDEFELEDDIKNIGFKVDENDDEPDEHLKSLLKCFRAEPTNYQDSLNRNSENSDMDGNQCPSPPKKAMFGPNDYQNFIWNGIYKIQQQLSGTSSSMDCGDEDNKSILNVDAEDDDMYKLEQSFAMDYWHVDMDVDKCHNQMFNELKQEQQQQQAFALQQDLDIEQNEDVGIIQDFKIKYPTKANDSKKLLHQRKDEFEKFQPLDTSSVVSHFSGIEIFKRPYLPTGLRLFKCSLIKVLSPTVLYIFPRLTEFEYRAMELSQRIKQIIPLVKPLSMYKRSTICLARFSADKCWYRALILSYNKVAEQVDVIYVDYLNTETLPVRYIRQCPIELISWPLRTFQVRLHGIKANPHLRSADVREALKDVIIAKQYIFARVKKTEDIVEVTLHENDDDNSAKKTIYEELIAKNIYQRM